jgi:hypothetical protein
MKSFETFFIQAKLKGGEGEVQTTRRQRFRSGQVQIPSGKGKSGGGDH